MPLFHLVLLALIQGITEFLPISSSGHLILLPGLTGLEDQGQALDVAVHVGTLFAVILYFRHDVGLAARGSLKLLRGRVDDWPSYLALCLLLATVPIILVGFALHATGLDAALRSVAVIGWAMLGFGLLLYWFDTRAPATRTDRDWTLGAAVRMGLWQMLALIPGTSRSGITITGARAMGYDRHGAAKLSMLMSIPTITASGVMLGVDLVGEGSAEQLADAGLAAVLAFASALAALTVMMRLLQSVSFTPYVIYRVILGVILLVYAYS